MNKRFFRVFHRLWVVGVDLRDESLLCQRSGKEHLTGTVGKLYTRFMERLLHISICYYCRIVGASTWRQHKGLSTVSILYNGVGRFHGNPGVVSKSLSDGMSIYINMIHYSLHPVIPRRIVWHGRCNYLCKRIKKSADGKGEDMKKQIKIIFLVSLLGIFVAGSAMAVTMNVRPFDPSTIGTGDLSALQAVFTGIGSSIDAVADQSAAAYFDPTGFGQSAAAFIAQVTWGLGNLEFGLYDLGDPTNMVTVIPGGATPLTTVTIHFDFVANTVTTRDTGGNVIDSASFTSPFGFYTAYTDYTAYSEDALNNGGEAQQLIYAAKGDDVSLPYGAPILTLNDIAHWYVACEALDIDNQTYPNAYAEGSYDFNDMVVMLESVEPSPVPEPMTILFLGLGLLGLGMVRRKD